GLSAGTHSLVMKVVDPTDYVRDPAIRNSTALTQTRTWTVNTATTTAPTTVAPAFSTSTPTTTPVAANRVVFVEPTHPVDRVFNIEWKIDGSTVSNPGNMRDLDLKRFTLSSGDHTLSATVTDPADPGGASQTLSWTIDAQMPDPAVDLQTPSNTVTPPSGP